MNSTKTTEAVKHLLGFPFRDPRWQSKLLIGSLVLFANFIIPILPYILFFGYVAQIIYRIVEGDGEMHLPEWSDLGKLLADGWRLFAANLVYSLPMIILMLIGYGAMFVPIFGLILGGDNAMNSDAGAVMMLLSQLVFFLFFGIAMFFGIIYMILSPAMMVHTAARQKFSAAFEIGSWFRILKANFWGFFAALVIMAGIYTALMYVIQITYMTIVCCWLIPFMFMPVSFYITVIAYALMAEAYKIGREKLALPTAVEPAQPAA